MNKAFMTLLVFALGLSTVYSVATADVQSLRGASSIEENSSTPTVKDYVKDQEPLDRDYLQQPPLIPHQIERYTINLKNNKCLSCHSWKNYRKHNATKISQTHFESRDGAVMSNVSSRRYFCTQCHVPQANVKPLIENTFQAVDAMKIN